MSEVYIYILVMALTSFAIRVLPLTLIQTEIKNPLIKSFLYYVPYITLAVMTFPAIIQVTQTPLSGAIALVIGIVLSWFGANFLEDVLSPDIIKAIQEITPYTPNKDGIETPSYVYANYFLARKVTQNERFEILKAVSDHFTTKLYTHNPTPELPDVINKGPIDFYDNMPYVFKCSKINLNIHGHL